MKQLQQLVDRSSGKVLLKHLEMANTFWTRFRGLMFRKRFPPSYGIWIKPCKSIHTMWMRTTIDVFFIDQAGKVIGVKKNVRPWRVALAPQGTASVLEVPAGTLELGQGTLIEQRPKDPA